MKINLKSSEPDVRIELIPLIDVIFCVLAFFILGAVTLTRQTAINVDLPKAGTGVTQMREMLIVSVDPIGQTYIDQQPVTREQLQAALINYQQQSPEGLMVLYASRLSSYNDVVQVLDILRAVGGDRVALATLPETGTESPSQFPQTPGFNPGTDPLLNPINPGNTLPGSNPYLLPPGGASDPYNPNQPFLPGTNSFPTSPSRGSNIPDTNIPGSNIPGSNIPGFDQGSGVTTPKITPSP
jgi:biopolymer transport protein ExbD